MKTIHFRLFLCLSILIFLCHNAESKKVLKRRKIKVKKDGTKSEKSADDNLPRAKVEHVDTVPEEKTKSARGLYFRHRSNADSYSQIFPPYTGNLWAIESKQDQVYNPLLTDNTQDAVADNPAYFPYEYEGYYGQDENQDKTLSGLGDVLGVSGEGQDDTMLARAALPVAVAGFLALTLSSLFSGQLSVNTTSSEAVPTLWQIPIDYKPPSRKRREAELLDNEVGVDAGYLGGLLKAGGIMGRLADVTERIQDGLILYAMAEADPECARKIACMFGAETRKSGHKGLIVGAVKRFMPEMMREFKDEFASTASARSFDETNCQMYSCSKCFSV